MKAADAKAPKFDSKWWKLNKAKDADPKGLFEGALSDYEKAKRDLAKATGLSDIAPVGKKLEIIGKVAKAIKADPKLGIAQKDTKDALTNYEKMAATSLASLTTLARDPDFNANLADLIKRQSKAFKAFLDSEFSPENYEFLVLMAAKKRTQQVYDRYVAEGSPKQVNIPSSTRIVLDAIAARGAAANWNDDKAWNQAASDIFALVQRDSFNRWKLWHTKQLLGKVSLP